MVPSTSDFGLLSKDILEIQVTGFTKLDGNMGKKVDDLLHLCWKHQECWGCLEESPCSWCPTSSTCVPNNAKIKILAPIFDADNVCPLWSEGWELRASPLGCHVSTITLLTCIISVLSTFVVIGLIAIVFKASQAIQRQWKTRSEDWWRVWKHYPHGWYKGWRLKLVDVRAWKSNEERPLLGP